MPPAATCCTCATLLSDIKIPYDPISEKPLQSTRHLECCHRDICASCQLSNPRFQTYCPFCQISTGPSALPKDGLRLPPSYTRRDQTRQADGQTHASVNEVEDPDGAPPSYQDSLSQMRSPPPATAYTPTPGAQELSSSSSSSSSQSSSSSHPDTIHHLSTTDTLASLSLSYSVPLPVLRRHNNLYSDTLLTARKTISIPSTHYRGPPLSTPPDPLEEAKKIRVRRWMVATKCADYAVAELYLAGAAAAAGGARGGGGGGGGGGEGGRDTVGADADEQLDNAVKAFKEDEEWEKRNPLMNGGKGKSKDADKGRRGRGFASVGGGLVGQLS